MKNIFLLKDTSTDKVDAVIITEKTTLNELQDAIYDAKAELNEALEKGEYDDCDFDFIAERLPDDCQVYSGDGFVWY